MQGVVVAVRRDEAHCFRKGNQERIRLLAGLVVKGDAHAGETVQHQSRVAVDPTQPNRMGAVIVGGEVRPGDPIRATLPAGPHQPLRCV